MLTVLTHTFNYNIPLPYSSDSILLSLFLLCLIVPSFTVSYIEAVLRHKVIGQTCFEAASFVTWTRRGAKRSSEFDKWPMPMKILFIPSLPWLASLTDNDDDDSIQPLFDTAYKPDHMLNWLMLKNFIFSPAQ